MKEDRTLGLHPQIARDYTLASYLFSVAITKYFRPSNSKSRGLFR